MGRCKGIVSIQKKTFYVACVCLARGRADDNALVGLDAGTRFLAVSPDGLAVGACFADGMALLCLGFGAVTGVLVSLDTMRSGGTGRSVCVTKVTGSALGFFFFLTGWSMGGGSSRGSTDGGAPSPCFRFGVFAK